MQLEVKGKNVEVSDSIRSYAESKLRRLERQLSDPTVVELELAVERIRPSPRTRWPRRRCGQRGLCSARARPRAT